MIKLIPALVIIALLLTTAPTFAQDPQICTGPGAAQWQDAGRMESPKMKFGPSTALGQLIIPDGPQVRRLIAQAQVSPNTPIALQSSVSRPGGYTLHIHGNSAYLIGGSTATTTVEYATVTPVLFGPWKATAPTIATWGVTSVPTGELYRVVSSDNFIYVLGYYSEFAPINPNGSLGAWQALPAAMPEYRESFSALIYNETLYIIGGIAVGGGSSRDALRSVKYTRLTNGVPGQWQSAPPMLLERSGPEAIVIGGYLYIIGGDNLINNDVGGHVLVERAKVNQDGSLGAWEFVTKMVIPRREFGLAKSGNFVYALGGTNTDPASTATPMDAVEAWDTSKPFPPNDYGVTINDGELFTNQITTTLTIGLAAPFDQLVQISNDGGFAGASWETYAPCKSWIITQYGVSILPRTVYVRFKNPVNGQLSPTFQDDIILDTTPPVGSVELQQPAELSAASVTVYLTARDDASGVGDMQVSLSPDFAGAEWEPFATSKTLDTSGGVVVYARFRDNAGNVSRVYSTGVPARVWLPVVMK